MKVSFPRVAYALALLLAAAYAVRTLTGPDGLRALEAKRAQIQALEKRNAALAQQIERKRERVRRLADNPDEQELEIRERLKLVRPDEKVYILGDPAKK